MYLLLLKGGTKGESRQILRFLLEWTGPFQMEGRSSDFTRLPMSML